MSRDDGEKGNGWKSGNRGSADLDAIVRDLQRKLAMLLGGGVTNRATVRSARERVAR